MYKLTIEVESHEELIEVVQRLGDHATGGELQAGSATTEKPARPSRSRGKKTTTSTAETMEDVPSKFAAQAPVTAHVPQAAAPQAAPATPGIDRSAYLQRATELVGILKSAGVQDEQVMPQIHQVMAQAGCPTNVKVSGLSDDQLVHFLPAFERKVQELVQAARAPQTAAAPMSFIYFKLVVGILAGERKSGDAERPDTY